MSGVGGTDCRKLKQAFLAGGLNVKELNNHEFWADGYIYSFPTSGEGEPRMIRCIRCPK